MSNKLTFVTVCLPEKDYSRLQGFASANNWSLEEVTASSAPPLLLVADYTEIVNEDGTGGILMPTADLERLKSQGWQCPVT